MINEFSIKNYKSIADLKLELGRVNLFIGENGSGKSNILEALTLAAAAAGDRLDNEFLVARGIRVTDPENMRAAFPSCPQNANICLELEIENTRLAFDLSHDNAPYSTWEHKLSIPPEVRERILASEPQGLESFIQKLDSPADYSEEMTSLHARALTKNLRKFLIYSPENSALRTFQKEGQIEPLGINGEGLLKLLSVHHQDQTDRVLAQIKQRLQVLDWFDDFSVQMNALQSRLQLRDRFLDPQRELDHRSANEGFFFLLFYYALFCSPLTPACFAIDNIDASLNPKLCEKLMLDLVQLAKQNDKQCLLTSHNPAILDGIDLEDDAQRLFVVTRNGDGQTRVRRMHKPQPLPGQKPARLSELFLRGALGGLPKGF